MKEASINPLIRWTIGPVSNLGFDILKESIRLVKNFYPEFNTIICFNQLNSEQIRKLEKLSNLYEQKHEILEYKPTAENWKIYPPRLSPTTHEIWLDNDVLITKKLSFIEDFLKTSTRSLLCEGLYRNYGKYDKNVNIKKNINSGLFGVPPNFDFEIAIKKFCSNDVDRFWSLRFDDQGIVAGILGELDPIIIPKSQIALLMPKDKFVPASAYHFLESNKSQIHYCWEEYRKKTIKFY